MPAVSVIIPSYNHDAYIGECIQSVLDQTFQDFEIIVTDDASSDGTVRIIEAFTDPRIKLFRNEINRGAGFTSNNCIRRSSGRYIAMLSSDDAWYPEKLRLQFDYLEAHPEIGAVFGKVLWINEAGDEIKDKSFPYTDVFDVKNRSRHEWLRHFFTRGNCLCHPCSLVRRECYDEVGLLDPRLANLPDFDLWIRLCLRYEIYVMDQKLIRFRRMFDESNASGDTNPGRIRNRFENRRVLDHYLKLTDPQDFLQVFPEASHYGKVSTETIPYLLGRIAIEENLDYKALWGLDVIYSALGDEQTAQLLEKDCKFNYPDFLQLSGQIDPMKVTAYFPGSEPPPAPPGLLRSFLLANYRYVREMYRLFIRVVARL